MEECKRAFIQLLLYARMVLHYLNNNLFLFKFPKLYEVGVLCAFHRWGKTQRVQLSSQGWEWQGWHMNPGLAGSGDHVLSISPVCSKLPSLGHPQTLLSLGMR